MKNRYNSLLLVPIGFFIARAAFLAPAGNLYSQHHVTYEIQVGSKYKAVELEPALDMCDLTKYRKEDKRVKMLFDDDTIVELFSANELMGKGIEVETDYINKTDRMLLNIFRLHPDGWLIEDATKISKEETMLRLKKLQD